MTIGYPGLFMIVLSSAFVGCCVGVVVMGGCKVWVMKKRGGGSLRQSPPPRPPASPPKGGSGVPPHRHYCENQPPKTPRPSAPPPQGRKIQESEG